MAEDWHVCVHPPARDSPDVPLRAVDPDAVNVLDEVTHRPHWHTQAACRGKGLDLFFPERGESPAQAKALCANCPVQRQCLDVALADASVRGIWGGVSDKGRVGLRRGAA